MISLKNNGLTVNSENTYASARQKLRSPQVPGRTRGPGAGKPVRSREEFIALQRGFMTTFPDQHVRLEQMIAEGDHVAVRAIYTGTQSGPMGDFPASGNKVDGPFIAFFRIESGKIAELWVEWDNVAMLTQLGVLPPAEPSND